ncbi:MAG: alpha/beta hydrolase [Candidatus Omnitrophota bacterium]
MLKNIFILFLSLLAVLAYIRYVEKRSIFVPSSDVLFTPADINLPFEDVYFNTADGNTLNAWFVPANGAKYTLVFFHGNAGNLSHRLEKLAIFNELRLNVFIIDYRGYGKSKGRPSEAGLYEDGVAAYNYLTADRKIPADSLIIYGESLGTAVAIDLASQRPAKALIVDSGFSSAKDMSRVVFPLLPTIFLSTRFDSRAKVRKITCPKLIIHSLNDEIVPFKLGEAIFDNAPAPKELLKLRGPHNSAFMDSKQEFIKGIGSFIDKL